MIRAEEDIDLILDYSKLDKSNLHPTVQCLSFANDLTTDSLRILELDNELYEILKNSNCRLSEINVDGDLCVDVTNGTNQKHVIDMKDNDNNSDQHCLMIKAPSKTDNVVLCTNDKTYAIKEAETSNMVMLAPNLKFPGNLTEEEKGTTAISSNEKDSMEEKKKLNIIPVEIRCNLQKYLEPRLIIKPRLTQLRSLLEQRLISNNQINSSNYFSFGELLSQVQLSKMELKNGLRSLDAINLTCFPMDKATIVSMFSRWALLDFDYVSVILSSILTLLDNNSLPVNEVPLAPILSELIEEYPDYIIQHVYESFTLENEASDDVDGHIKDSDDDAPMMSINEYSHLPSYVQNIKRSLNAVKVCRHLAEILLRSTRKFNLSDFMKTWELSVPEVLRGKDTEYKSNVVNLSMLGGLALVDKTSRPNTISHFPEWTLSDDIQERFDQLFMAKTRWTLDEISPYIVEFTTKKLSVAGLLTKYARSSMCDGVKLFNSKKPILGR